MECCNSIGVCPKIVGGPEGQAVLHFNKLFRQ